MNGHALGTAAARPKTTLKIGAVNVNNMRVDPLARRGSLSEEVKVPDTGISSQAVPSSSNAGANEQNLASKGKVSMKDMYDNMTQMANKIAQLENDLLEKATLIAEQKVILTAIRTETTAIKTETSEIKTETSGLSRKAVNFETLVQAGNTKLTDLERWTTEKETLITDLQGKVANNTTTLGQQKESVDGLQDQTDQRLVDLSQWLLKAHLENSAAAARILAMNEGADEEIVRKSLFEKAITEGAGVVEGLGLDPLAENWRDLVRHMQQEALREAASEAYVSEGDPLEFLGDQSLAGSDFKAE